MEGSNPTPYVFVKEIFIALRRLFIIFLLYFKCFTIAFVCVCSFFVVVFCLFLFLVFSPFKYNSFHYQIIQHVHLQYKRIQRK